MKQFSEFGKRLSRSLVLCGLLTGLASAQQTGAIRGAVTTLGPDGQPVFVPGVSLLLQCHAAAGPPATTTTDEAGEYSFAKLAPGTCRLTASSLGFRSVSKDIDVRPGPSTELDIRLDLETVIQRVEVQARAEKLSTEAAAPASTLQSEQLETLPMAEQAFRDALRVVPGVVRTNDGKLNIRGSSETQGMLQVNSVETTDPVTGAFSIRIPADAIQKLSTDKAPFDAQYGGFSGGLTTIETKPPSGEWNWKASDFLPSIRGKGGQWVGYSEWVPRLTFGGPLLPGKLNFLEAIQGEIEKAPVRGLPWPRNEIRSTGVNSYSSFQLFLSPSQIVTANINVFPRRIEFANITALIPQTASSNYGQSGMSGDVSDLYQFSSGALLKTGVRYTRFDSRANGQGPEDMLVTPGGWAGNFFNRWAHNSRDFEVFSVFQFASKNWHGRHDFKVGSDLGYRSFTGSSASHPVQILRQDGSLAEQIDFQDNGPLSASVTEGGAFVQDHWAVNGHVGLDFGGRLTSQSIGRSAAFAPRLAVAYSPSSDSKTIIRAGAGLFDGRVSLLDADFAHNPTRVVSLFGETGTLVGTPTAFQNTYVANGGGPLVSRIRRRPDKSPRTFLTNVEIDRQLSKSSALRLTYIYSRTYDIFVVDPLPGEIGGESFLTLSNSGVTRYHEFEATLHLQPVRRSDLNLSYIWSRNRGDLNTSSEIFVPFEQPVIRPNVFTIAPADVPNRFVAWGTFRIPWGINLSPVFDIQTGLPYSDLDVLQNYVGRPNGRRFPTFVSLDTKIYRDFHLPLPGVNRSSRRKVRLGLYSMNLTNHKNYNDVFRNVTSPFFGQFAGFEHRINGFVLEIVE
jgi:Carboxypeptidase regulatory-like domain/TonB-dependent Receptor Plug Domain